MRMKCQLNTLYLPVTAMVFALGVLAVTPVALAGKDNSLIRDSVNHPDRTPSDRERDAGRKPFEVLTFFGVGKGDSVLEVGAGAGYYTELFSRAVGDDGFVYAYNPFFFLNGISEELKPRYSDGELDNVVLSFGSLLKTRLPKESFDSAFFINTYHDIHYSKSSGEAMSPASRASLAEIFRVMKPGGTLGIVDHRAAVGFSRAEAAAAHRLSEEVLKSDMRAAGFEYVGATDVLANSTDQGTKAFFDEPGLRGNTNRLVLAFRKPE